MNICHSSWLFEDVGANHSPLLFISVERTIAHRLAIFAISQSQMSNLSACETFTRIHGCCAWSKGVWCFFSYPSSEAMCIHSACYAWWACWPACVSGWCGSMFINAWSSTFCSAVGGGQGLKLVCAGLGYCGIVGLVENLRLP